MIDLHLTKKDFKIDWFSGTGKGGQHRNKHQNCCRITHIETGLVGQGTESRERTTNQKVAFNRLAKKIIALYSVKENTKENNISNETIRTYHAERNEVKDKASGFIQPYKYVVEEGNIKDMIEARIKAKSYE